MLVAMAFAIPTLTAQDKLYVAVSTPTTASGSFKACNADASDQSISLSSSGAYEGTVTLYYGQAFSFYTGSAGNPQTWYGSISSGTGGNQLLNFQTANPITPTKVLTEGFKGGWYISKWADGTQIYGTTRQIKMTVEPGKTPTFEELADETPSYPEALYILRDTGYEFPVYATMNPVEGKEGVYSASLTDVPENFRYVVSLSNSSYLNCYIAPDTLSLGYGKSVELETSLKPATNNLNGTILVYSGNYTIQLDYNSKVMTITNDTKPVFRMVKFDGTGTAQVMKTPMSDSNPTLTYNPETGLYEGEISSVKTPYEYIKFYYVLGNDTIWTGWMNKNTDLVVNPSASLQTQATAQIPSASYVGTYYLTETSDWHDVGGFYISGWAAGRVNLAGTAKVALDLEKSIITLTKLDAFEPVPDVVWVKGQFGAEGYNNNIAQLQPTDTENVYQGVIEMTSTPLYFMLSNVQSITSGLIWAPDAKTEINLTGTYTTTATKYDNNNPFTSNPALYYVLNGQGKVMVSFNYKTGELKLSAVGENPEKIGVAMATGFMAAPAPAASDVFLMPTPEDPNIYKGLVNFKKNAAFGFYVGTPGSSDYILYRAHGFSAISCTQNNYWPVDEEEAAEAVLEPGSTMGNWYFSAFSNTSVNAADYTVEINWLTKTFRIFEEEIIIPTPEKLYLYASVDGGQNYLQVEEMTNPVNGVFSVKYNIPEVPTFVISDPDFSPADGDPDHGWRFYLYKPADEISGNTILGAELGAQVLEFVGDAPAVRTLVTSGTGMFVLEPGVATISYNWATNELQVTKPEIDESIKDVIYYLHADNYFNGPWVPNPETDPQLTYDPVSKTYVLDEPILVNKTGGFRFYRQNVSGTTTYITPMMATQIQIGADYSWKQSFELRNTSAWRFLTFHDPEAKEAEVTLTVDLVNTTLAVTQVSKDKNPEQIYIWFADGTEDAMGLGYVYRPMTNNPMKPIEEGGAVYTTTWDVPEITGLELNDKGAPDHGAFFYMSTSTSQSGGTRYLGYYGNTEGVYGPTIEFSASKKEVTMPVLTGGETASFVIVTPGKCQLTLDLDKAILTVEYLEDIVPEPEDNTITLNFSGVELADLASALQVLDAMNDGETLLINENPFDYVYTQGVFLMFIPQEGYDVAVKCASNDADVVDGTYSINVGAAPMDDEEEEATAGDAVTLMAYPAANGLTFNVVLSEHQTSGINALYDLGNGELRVFNLQGVQVLRTQNASDLNVLEPGLYIINGKKVVVRK